MEEPIVEVSHLKKYFSSGRSIVKAVDGVDLQVVEGQIFAFLGPNGAGKTTTLRILTTLLPQDSGEARVAGFDVKKAPDQVRLRIGYVSQTGGADRPATGRENLILQGQLYGMATAAAKTRADELIRLLDLTDFAGRIVNTYSGGQVRRLDVALGLMNRPKVLFLDEPTIGLDPQNRANLWLQIKKLRQEGTTVFLTTHYMEEADALCDSIAIIDNGRIAAAGTPLELKKKVSGDCITISIDDAETKMPQLISLLEKADFACDISRDNSLLRFYVKDSAQSLSKVMDLLKLQEITLQTITLSPPSLDDVFLSLTGRPLRDIHAEGDNL